MIGGPSRPNEMLAWPFRRSERVYLVDTDEDTWAFAGRSCDGCAITQQVNGLVVLAAGSLGKFCCGPVRSQGMPVVTITPSLAHGIAHRSPVVLQ